MLQTKTQWEFAFAECIQGIGFAGNIPIHNPHSIPWQSIAATSDSSLAGRSSNDRSINQLKLVPNIDHRFVGARNNNLSNNPNEKLGVFNIVDLSASYDVTKNWQAYVRVDNLFNEDYEEIFLFGRPIRSVFGGVRMKYDLPI